MRKALQIIFAVVLVAALAMFARQQQTLGQQRQEIQKLTLALTDKSKQEMLLSQARCSETASKFLSNRHYESSDGLDYSNHFDAKLNKCFVLVSSYDPTNDFSLLNLFDAVEGKRYAEYSGHNVCDLAITHDAKKCALDSGQIWFDGNDAKSPSDFAVGFRGLRYGGGAGDENTQKTFRDHIQPFMND